ncbi:hypothetical protein I553_2075 [Mycobacterium xenopi 4042]|uniref:Uncharacterized protein n=1 Tax=Mycobacterium xenopi 4042 TaxID=1299334 RepID=X8DJT4_MYCXE|nr:hypothetical protein I553_2075 [Mycobacterium xenopi 4042]
MKTKRRLFRDPLSVVLVVVIVLALLIAGVIAAELYARHRADSVVAAATECVVQDKVSVSFGPTRFCCSMSPATTAISPFTPRATKSAAPRA